MSVEFNNEISLQALRKLGNPENVEKEILDLKIQSAMAQAEIFEKMENDKMMMLNALAETYESKLGGN